MSRREPWRTEGDGFRVPEPLGDRIFRVVFLCGPPLAVAAVVGFYVWVAFIADCSSIGWMPVQQTPARCLRGIMK